MNKTNLKRFALHIGIGAALAAIAGVTANIASLGLDPQIVAIISVVLGAVASFLRSKDASS